jgi:hypothetical protein
VEAIRLDRGAGFDAAIDLVGADLNEARDTNLARFLQQHPGSVDIGLDEAARLQQRAVDVRLGRKLTAASQPAIASATITGSAISPWMKRKRASSPHSQVAQIAGIGELVEHHDLGVVARQRQPYKGTPNEAGPASHQHTLEDPAILISPISDQLVTAPATSRHHDRPLGRCLT